MMVESTPSESLDNNIDIESKPESHVPTPPAGTPDSRSDTTAWRMFNTDNWTVSTSNSHSSPASSPPPLDDPPTFDDALNDPILTANLDPLALFDDTFQGEQANLVLSDEASRGSPSSVRAEFDQDRDSDLDLDTDASDELGPGPSEVHKSVEAHKSLASIFPSDITMDECDKVLSIGWDIQDNVD